MRMSYARLPGTSAMLPSSAWTWRSLQALIDGVHRPGDAIRICSGLDHLSEDDWRRVDHARSLLAREGCVVLVVAEQSIQRMFRNAPNLSWIGAAVWSFDDTIPTLSAEEKEARLEALRSWSGLSDAEVIERAEQDVLPGDPEYAEWLVLLDRGDLVERGSGE